MDQALRGMIIAEPGRIRECVQAMLVSLSQVESVELADDPDEALTSIKKTKTDFVLFGLHLPDIHLQSFLKALKTESPKTQSLVFVENIVQQQLARVAGADQVLLQGATAEQFIEALCKIVPSDLMKEHLQLCSDVKQEQQTSEELNLTRR